MAAVHSRSVVERHDIHSSRRRIGLERDQQMAAIEDADLRGAPCPRRAATREVPASSSRHSSRHRCLGVKESTVDALFDGMWSFRNRH